MLRCSLLPIVGGQRRLQSWGELRNRSTAMICGFIATDDSHYLILTKTQIPTTLFWETTFTRTYKRSAPHVLVIFKFLPWTSVFSAGTIIRSRNFLQPNSALLSTWWKICCFMQTGSVGSKSYIRQKHQTWKRPIAECFQSKIPCCTAAAQDHQNNTWTDKYNVQYMAGKLERTVMYGKVKRK